MAFRSQEPYSTSDLEKNTFQALLTREIGESSGEQAGYPLEGEKVKQMDQLV